MIATPKPLAAILPLAIFMWLAMLLTHELGHVAAAWLTGGRVVYLELGPASLPSTLVQPNPHPGAVVWGGIVSGWLIPTGIALACRRPAVLRRAASAWAAFCWLAGGTYLAIGGFERLTDSGQLIAAGWPVAVLFVIGLLAAAIGYAWSRRVWPGLLEDLAAISRRAVAVLWLALVAWISLHSLAAQTFSRWLTAA